MQQKIRRLDTAVEQIGNIGINTARGECHKTNNAHIRNGLCSSSCHDFMPLSMMATGYGGVAIL